MDEVGWIADREAAQRGSPQRSLRNFDVADVAVVVMVFAIAIVMMCALG